MNSVSFVFNALARLVRLAVCAALVAVGPAGSAEVEADPDGMLTNVLQVKNLVALGEVPDCNVRLEGVVLWVSPVRDELILQDASGGILINADLRNAASIGRGQRILIEGRCRAGPGGITFGLVINDDGIHASAEKSGSVALSAGLHPISVEWFNGPRDFVLELDCMGPGLSRQPVPGDLLFRTDAGPAGGTNQMSHGLDCRCYEGAWGRLPDFSRLPVVKSGMVPNFDLQFRSRDTDVGLAFSGYFQAPQAGEYTFWLRSDDGSILHLGDRPPVLKALGESALPAPQPIVPGRLIPVAEENRWGEVEGMVTRVSEVYGGVSVELTSDAGRAYLKITGPDRDYLKLLPHSRIRAVGICRNALDIDGETCPSLLVPDSKAISLIDVDPTHWADYPVVSLRSLSGTNEVDKAGTLVHISGNVCSNSTANLLVIDDQTGRISIETSRTLLHPGDPVEVIGWCGRAGGNLVLKNGSYRKALPRLEGEVDGMPLLTTALQVKSLSRTEAERGYPVKIRGVVTANIGADFVIQDSTSAIYVQWNGSVIGESPKIGDYWEIAGKSYVDFAPNIRVERAVRLGTGILPEPLHPTNEELINGSLDVQYIELDGIVTSIEGNTMTLLTRQGKIKVQLLGEIDTSRLEKLQYARVRVRGVDSPQRDSSERMAAPLLLFNASVSVDEPVPSRPFEAPLKNAMDLLSFDARADAFRRVKITGQLLEGRNGEYFLTDGTNGFRFETKEPVTANVGDLLEVVGFPDISGPSPVLHEALVRVTGETNLPPAQTLEEDTMLNGRLDATLVSMKSRLIGLGADGSDQILELQTGTHNYLARLAKRSGPIAGILPGSLLELTGVYIGFGGDRASGRDINSFELLLDSRSDIRVLAYPPWWNFRRTMIALGLMLSAILVALFWISLLHRQVNERTMQLTAEIKDREQAEYQRAIEEERARIASDLHDELGAALTEIRFLGAAESRDLSVPEPTRLRLRKVSQRSHQMVSSLDEIVWAINPANDSLPNLADYLCQTAEEFFRPTEVRCRLDLAEFLPPVAVTSEVRHNLYLVIREALNNIARHSQATEVWLRIHWKEDALNVVIEDNGRGFDDTEVALGNGLLNMRRRLEKIGGRFEIGRQADSGTVCRIWLSFAKTPA